MNAFAGTPCPPLAALMRTRLIFDPDVSAEQMRGFTRTVAEIEWLMLILVLILRVYQGLPRWVGPFLLLGYAGALTCEILRQ